MNGASGRPLATRTDVVVSEDGTAIAYRTVGNGPPVLVVPGALAVANDFEGFARELAERLTVHTTERRGRGESGPQGDDYSIERECEDLAALQAATGARFLFGHSFGGLIAREAARGSKAFEKVAVYEPGVSIGGSIDMSWAPICRAQLARGRQLDAFITFARGINPETTGKAPRWMLRLILPVAIRKREREQKYRLLPAAIREHAEAARLDNTYPHYREVTAEVLLMAGKDATATGAGRASQSLLPVLSKATLATFPALDHFGPEKKPAQVAEAVSTFFPRVGQVRQRLDDVSTRLTIRRRWAAPSGTSVRVDPKIRGPRGAGRVSLLHLGYIARAGHGFPAWLSRMPTSILLRNRRSHDVAPGGRSGVARPACAGR
jgi:pimeloyl-ACP methyl ester carboxylesterase